MDEISRELPPDTTTRSVVEERTKGPEEFVLADRGGVREDLVVNDMIPAEGSGSSEGAPHGSPRASLDGDGDGPREARFRQLAEGSPAGAELPSEPVPPGLEPLVDALAAAGAAALASIPEPDFAAAGLPGDGEQPTDCIDAAAAAAAVAEEAEVVEIEEEASDAEGLPPVPELASAAEVARMVYVLMLTSREGLSLLRLAQACNTTQKLVEQALDLLQANLRGLGLPVELARNGDSVKWMSGAEAFPYLQRLRGVKKLDKLSPAALETLAVIAYRQPVMRSEIEAIRGVKAGPMLRMLLQHKLVSTTRAEVPGRPLQYGTTQQFLERFGLSSLQELPSLREWKNLG